MALGLVVQGFAERQDEGLGREIDGHSRSRLEGGGRGDIEDAARFVRDHAGQHGMRQLRSAQAAIQIDHLERWRRPSSLGEAGR
jgi:hypothetical protein